MKIAKDDDGMAYNINPDHVSMVTESYIEYADGEVMRRATEVWIGCGYFTINASVEYVMASLFD